MFDIAIIGAGSGGLTVAAGAAQFGRRVILFEKGAMGGDCLNSGCVPSKSLIAKAKTVHTRRKTGDTFDEAHCFASALKHVREVIASIAPHDSIERFEGLGVTVVPHAARFLDAHKIEAGGKIYAAGRIVIAAGSRPAVPPIPGIANVPFLTNESIFNLDELPSHLMVLGGGPIGIELAQAFRRFGAQVTIMEAAKPLGREDEAAARVVLDQLAAEGVRILSSTKALSVELKDGAVQVATDSHGTISGSHLLVATGRKPNIEGLNLDAAQVASTTKGITVDASMRTSQKHIYAVGDIAGGPQFTHAANQQAGLVLRHALFRLPVKFKPEDLPRVTYSDPEIAAVGLSEAEAREQFGSAVRIHTSGFDENDRARTERRTEGFIKTITTDRGKILGAVIVGVEAGLLLEPWVLAREQGLKLRAMAEHVIAYPSRAEAGKRAALLSYSALPRNPWLRYAIQLINRFL